MTKAELLSPQPGQDEKPDNPDYRRGTEVADTKGVNPPPQDSGPPRDGGKHKHPHKD